MKRARNRQTGESERVEERGRKREGGVISSLTGNRLLYATSQRLTHPKALFFVFLNPNSHSLGLFVVYSLTSGEWVKEGGEELLLGCPVVIVIVPFCNKRVLQSQGNATFYFFDKAVLQGEGAGCGVAQPWNTESARGNNML